MIIILMYCILKRSLNLILEVNLLDQDDDIVDSIYCNLISLLMRYPLSFEH